MKFSLEIELDNAGCRSSHDLASLLSKIGLEISRHNYVKQVRDEKSKLDLERKVRDVNGNTVGSWKLSDK